MGGVWAPTVSLLGLSSLTSQCLVSCCLQRKAKDGPTSMVSWGGLAPGAPMLCRVGHGFSVHLGASLEGLMQIRIPLPFL